jgi:prevent-host-death family protein
MNAPARVTIVALDDAEANLDALVDRAHRGEEIVITLSGEPWVKLVAADPPAAPRVQRQPGGWPELANVPESVWSDPLPDEELDYIDPRPEAERR